MTMINKQQNAEAREEDEGVQEVKIDKSVTDISQEAMVSIDYEEEEVKTR